jgi:thioredoxin reductase
MYCGLASRISASDHHHIEVVHESRLAECSIKDTYANIKTSGAVERIPATVLFVLIGAAPNTDWLGSAVQRSSKDFIVTGHDVDLHKWPLARQPMSFETSMPGIFAVGDVRLGSMKRVASAVGEGAGAVQNIHQYLQECASISPDVAQNFPTLDANAA